MEERFKFVLETEAQGADQAQQKSTSAIQNVGRVFTAVRDNVQKAAAETKKGMDAIVNQVSSTAALISNKYNNMSLTQLQNEFLKIEERIQKQEALVRQTNQALEEYAAFLDEIARRGGGAVTSTADYDARLASLAKTAGDASRSLVELKAQQQQVAEAVSVKSAGAKQMAEMNAQLAATKQTGAQAKMGLDMTANGLQVIGRATGGVGSNIAALAMEVRFLKQGFTTMSATAGKSAATMSTAFGAAGIAIMAVMMIVNAIAQAEEEAKRKAEELREEIKQMSSDNQGAAKLVAEFERLNNKAVKTADETQRMLDIRAELVDTYGFSVAAVDEEGRLLSGNLELMKEQLKISREMLLTKLQADEASQITEYNDALKKQTELQKSFTDERRKTLEVEIASLEAKKAAGETTVTVGGPYSGYKTQDIQSLIDQYKASISDFDNQLKDVQTKGKKAIDALFRLMILEIQTGGKEVSEALQQTIKEAMKSAFLGGTELKDVQSMAQNMLDSYFAIDTGVADSAIAAIQELKEELIAALVSGDEIEDTDAAKNMIQSILDAAMGDDAMQAAYDRAAELKQKIYAGLASSEEMAEYDTLIGQIAEQLKSATNSATWSPAVDALRDLRKEVTVTSAELMKMAAAEAAADKTLKDAASDLRSVASGYESVSKAVKEVGDMKAAVKAIEDYNGAAVKSQYITRKYADAKAWLADKYGVEKAAIDDMLPSIQDDINVKEALALADYLAGMQAANSAKAQVLAMQTAGTIVPVEAAKMITALDGLIRKYQELAAYSISGSSVTASGSTPVVIRSSGGGSSTNKALQKQLDLISHKRALEQITTAEEIALLEAALKKYAKTTAEKNRLTEQIYALKRQKEQDDLEYQQAMDQLTLREEIAAIDKMILAYKAGTEARKDLERQRYELARQLERQEYDLKVHYGQITLAQQEAYLKELIASYKEGVAARIELEKELYDVQQSIRKQHIDELSSLAEAVVGAIRARYESMRDTEKENLQASMDAWKDWGDAQIEALQAQMAALDALTKQEDAAEVEAAKRRKVAALEQQLQYEQDAYNRRKLQDELAKAQADLTDWLTKQEREAQKAALQAQIDNVNKTVDEQTAALENQINAVDEYYAQLTEEQKLQAEAQRLILQGSQEDILGMLQAYASDYNITGQTLGEQLVDGFLSAVGDIDTWWGGLVSRLTAYQAELAAVANAAADDFYAVRGMTSTNTTNEYVTKVISPTINITVNGSGSEALGLTPSERQQMIDEIVAAMTDM